MKHIASLAALFLFSFSIALAQTHAPLGPSGGSGTPTGAAGGDLTGTYPNPGVGKISGTTPGTGVVTALGVNVGTAGAFVVNGGALGTPSGGVATNITGLPISTGLTGAGTNVLTLLGANAGAGTWTCSALTNATAYCSAAIGQLPGTTTNDSASAGNIGEYVVSGASSNNNLNVSPATVTITIASPGVVSWTGNPYFTSASTGNGCASSVVFATSGALPTGITAGTTYYVTCDGTFTANAFHISTTVANAIAGTAVNTSGTQSGTQTATNSVTLATGTAQDFGGLSLTAGTWDITGVVLFSPAATTSVNLSGGVITSGSANTGTNYSRNVQRQSTEVPGALYVLPMSVERIFISSNATYFCGLVSVFTVSTMSASGECRATRVR